MSRRLKTLLFATGGLLLLAGAAYGYARRAMREVQPFYAAAIQLEPQVLATAGRRMASRVLALYSDAQAAGRWQTVFTDEEVNGWLAVILKEKYSDLLPPQVSDPRVAFTEDGCKVGFRYQGAQFDAMISVEAEAYMVSEDLAAVRLLRARAGALPLPLADVVDEISDAAWKLEIPVRWTQQDEDPVLLIPVADALSTDDELRRLERLKLRDGELVLAGKTEPRPDPKAEIAQQTRAAGAQ